jgi:hypothetical protein
MKLTLATAALLGLGGLPGSIPPLYDTRSTSLPRSKKFTGARKIQRAAKKRRNARRSRA